MTVNGIGIILSIPFAIVLTIISSHATLAQGNAVSPSPMKQCWETRAPIVAEAGIAADKTQGYFVNSESKLVAVDLKSGDVNWTAEFGGEAVSEAVLTAGDVILATRVNDGPSNRHEAIIRSFSKATGLANWQVKVSSSSRYYIDATERGLTVVGDSGEMWLLSESNGNALWKTSTMVPIRSIPRFGKDRLLLATNDKKIVGYSLLDGQRKSEMRPAADPDLIGIADEDASVYSDAKGNVYSADESGDVKWKFRAGARVVFVRPVGDNVLLGSADNFVYFMSMGSGNLLWKRRLPGRIASGGLIGETQAAFTVIGDRSGYVIELEKGRVIDRLTLGSEDAFLLTPIRANGIYLLVATVNGLSAFSSSCGNEKSGERAPLL